MGPKFVVVKKGEHGCILVHRDGIAALPAYPDGAGVDPTGAGDSFAGGMMGHLASHPLHKSGGIVSFQALRRRLAHGTVVASFNIESFSLERLSSLKRAELDKRYAEFVGMVSRPRLLRPPGGRAPRSQFSHAITTSIADAPTQIINSHSKQAQWSDDVSVLVFPDKHK